MNAPQPAGNRPGLPAIAYRIRDYAGFRRAMLDQLPFATVPPVAGAARTPLRALGTRNDDDYAVALIDLFAYIGDVLSFYQERIANENYLGTATRAGNLNRLAAMLDYRPAPGVAATTHLAFTLDPPTPAVPVALLGSGLRVQSVPGQDQEPQKFETLAPVTGRNAFNMLVPVQEEPQVWDAATDRVHLAAGSAVRPGDALLLAGIGIGGPGEGPGGEDGGEGDGAGGGASDHGEGGTGWMLRHAASVTADPARTTVTLDEPLGAPAGHLPSAQAPSVHVMATTAGLFGQRAPVISALPEVARRHALGQQFTVTTSSTATTTANSTTVATTITTNPGEGAHPVMEWPFAAAGGAADTVDLDARYPKAAAGSWAVLADGDALLAAPIATATPAARNDYQLAANVTRLRFGGPGHDVDATDFSSHPRTAVVLLETGSPALAGAPRTDPVGGDRIEVQGRVDLEPGRPLVVCGAVLDTDGERGAGNRGAGGPGTGRRNSGGSNTPGDGTGERPRTDERPDAGQDTVAEVAWIARTVPAGPNTTIVLSGELAHRYVRAGLAVFANVAPAAHGEAVTEVLGNGDAATAFQSFTLARAPLTYRRKAGAPQGAASTLEVRVDGVLWREVRSLYGCTPDDAVYTTATTAAGATRVMFGDGVAGRLLPTGRNNVVATYRHGSGPAGNLPAATLTTLLDRPLGAKRATNPVPAVGGAAPEDPRQVRGNAPNTVRTFGRIVGLRDFEDAAREYAGIAKARAWQDWDGLGGIVRLAVAGDDGAVIAPGGALHRALLADLDTRRDVFHRLEVIAHDPLPIELAATVLVDAPAHLPGDVLAAVRAALGAYFGFDTVDLGAAVHLSDLYPVFHAVPGVLAVDIETFHGPRDPDGRGRASTTVRTVFAAGHQLPVLADPTLAGITATTALGGTAP